MESLIASGPALLDLDGGVARLQLNRPTAANGLDIDMLVGLHAALQGCIAEPRVRVLLMTGKGPNFCAGGDVHAFAAQGADLPHYIRRATGLLQEVIGALIHLDAPVICAAHGYTAGGGGLGLVCASDLVIAAESAKFLAGATRVGMAPDAGLSVTLPRLVGARKAAEILLFNPVITAAELVARAEDTAIFHSFPDGRITGIVDASPHQPVNVKTSLEWPRAVAEAKETLRAAGVNGPYALALGVEAYKELSADSDDGYPLRRRIEENLIKTLVWAPALRGGAVLLSIRGGDFELTVGQDLSIGYAVHDRDTVELYLTESFTFRVLEDKAAIFLRRELSPPRVP